MAKLYFKYGVMGSSKSAQALITKFNYEERGMSVWLIKPSVDTRDGADVIQSRIGLRSQAEVITPENSILEAYHLRGPRDVIIVEGILIYADPRLCQEMDIKIFVDTDADVRILRRIQRDVQDRGRSLDSVINQYLTTVKPMHEQFVEPSKRQADVIIPEGGENQVALEMVVQRVRAHLENS